MTDNTNWIQESADKIRDKLAAITARKKGELPFRRTNSQADYRCESDPFYWANGFRGGILWQMYHATGDRDCLAGAIHLESALAANLAEPEVLGPVAGFQFMPTAVADFHLTRNESSKKRGLDAADALAGCFRPEEGGYLDVCCLLGESASGTHSRRGRISMDSLLQLPLLYWASETTRDAKYRGMAVMHAENVMKRLLRADGSARIQSSSEPEQVQSLAQALAIYGFTLSFLHTSDIRFLKAAEKAAAFFLSEIPEGEASAVPEFFVDRIGADHIEDADTGAESTEEDADRAGSAGSGSAAGEDDCAAVIATCGLLLLSGQIRADKENAAPANMALSMGYASGAIRILRPVLLNHVDYRPETDILLGDAACDYFLVEALWKLIGREHFIWG